jgi:signal transduction histidine kinase
VNIIKRHKIFSTLAQVDGLKPAPPVWWIFCLLFLAICNAFSADKSSTVLSNAVDIISLPADQASRLLKVHVTGVVTASDPVLKGRFFLQDSTGGVFVDNVNGAHLDPGEMVEISGITYAGAYAPTVTAPKVHVIGRADLPPAKPVSIDQLMSGSEDSQRIQISGIVRDAKLDGTRLTIDLVAGGYRFRAFLPSASNFNPEKLIGAEALVRGTAAEAHNRSLRQLIAIEIYIPNSADLVVEKPDPINPFDRPIIPLNKLAQFRRDNSLAQRVHVRGVVTYQQPGQRVFLQNTTFGLQIQSRQKIKMAPGEVIDAVGFLSFENYLPVLQDAVFRETGEPPIQITPQPATSQDLENGLYHANYISISGDLIQLTVNASSPASQGSAVMVLQTSNFTFTALAENVPGQARLADLAIGSMLNIRGIGLAQIDSAGTLQSFQLLIRNGSDVTVIRKPSWLTPNRLLIGVLILCSALFLIVSWSVVLSRKNAALNVAIGEREKAQDALQQANDKLEERVKERTEQLKFEITARKESEVQFQAVLSERTRLAQELHDTVEQSLTGIALQLDTASKLHHRNPDNSLRHLELARSMMAKSQVEVRRSVWDLRSRAMEQFDLSNALAEGARQITSGTDIKVQLKTEGEPQALPEVVEENLLRIGQEALANIIKHSRATGVDMELQFAQQQVRLQVKDNGIGFDCEKAVGPNEGHFGLLGMSERARRLGGHFSVSSKSGDGTLICVEIPLSSAGKSEMPSKVNTATLT